jgi:hypothetical protein
MDVVNQSFDDRLVLLQAAFSRADRVTELAFDHRVYRFGLPTLSKQAIQARLGNQLGSCSALRVKQITTPSNRRNQIIISDGLAI